MENNNSETRATAERPCFLCQTLCKNRCRHCDLVNFCCDAHYELHRLEDKDYCFPYEAAHKEGIGRILVATRVVKPMEVVLVDPGTIVGPNYSSKPVCLECLLPVRGEFVCPGCEYPMCDAGCAEKRAMHTQRECSILGRRVEWPDALKLKGPDKESNAYSAITPLRTLLLEDTKSDGWKRTNQLLDHVDDRRDMVEEWDWYQTYICKFFREDLQLKEYSEERINRAIGLLNINAVALHLPNNPNERDTPGGKGLYPVFAIMSHYCICNARYTIHPKTLEMYVRARRRIAKGEEISVQYLSALYGSFKRRKKIKDEWFFDCECRRCSDPTECGSNISAVKCFECLDDDGYMLPRDPLNYDSLWQCNKCSYSTTSESVELLADAIEEDLEEISRSREFETYGDFIDKYAGTVLHRNHYLVMIATRNLVQYLTYGVTNEMLTTETLRKKHELCKNFNSVLSKVDPGFSEIRDFVQKELNFCRLLLCQSELQLGLISREDYLRISRQSLNVLDDVERNKKIIRFET